MVDKKLFNNAVLKLHKIADSLDYNEDLYKDLYFAKAHSLVEVKKAVANLKDVDIMIDEKNQSVDYYHGIIPILLRNYAQSGWDTRNVPLAEAYGVSERAGCLSRSEKGDVGKFISTCDHMFGISGYNTPSRPIRYLKDYFEKYPDIFEDVLRGFVSGSASDQLVEDYIYQLINQRMYNFTSSRSFTDRMNYFVDKIRSVGEIRDAIIDYLAENKDDFINSSSSFPTQKTLKEMLNVAKKVLAGPESMAFETVKNNSLFNIFNIQNSPSGNKLRNYLEKNSDKPVIQQFNGFFYGLAQQIAESEDVQDLRTVSDEDYKNMVEYLSSDLAQIRKYATYWDNLTSNEIRSCKVESLTEILKKLSEVSKKREDFTNPNIYGILSYKKGQKVAEHVVEEPVEEVVSSDEPYESAVLTSPVRTQTESILTKYNLEKNDNVIDKYKKYQQSKNLIKKSYAKEVQEEEISTKEILDAIRESFTAEDWENAHETLGGEFLKHYYADIIRTLFESDHKDVDTKDVILNLTDTALDLGM